MGALYQDTHARMEDLQVQFWQQADPTRKMHMLAQLNATLRTLALAGLRLGTGKLAHSSQALRIRYSPSWRGSARAERCLVCSEGAFWAC